MDITALCFASIVIGSSVTLAATMVKITWESVFTPTNKPTSDGVSLNSIAHPSIKKRDAAALLGRSKRQYKRMLNDGPSRDSLEIVEIDLPEEKQ